MQTSRTHRGKRPGREGRPFHHGRRGQPSRAPFRARGQGGQRGRKRFLSERIDVSRYINKAVITEAVEHFVPEHRFADFAIDARLKAAIAKKGYTEPTPIQDRTISHILRREDVVGIANTGTGKTAAFLVPLIDKILKHKDERVLVMVPTRELAQQIEGELRGFAAGLSVHGVVCVGGVGIGAQMAGLRRRPHFVIGTPGRLKDLLERKALSLADFRTAVLDEADRMLDMGFVHDMRKILSLLPSPRHTLFFAATFSREIEKLVGEFLRTPVRVSVKTQETAASIEQDVVRIPPGKQKLDVLYDLLIQPAFNKVLVFGRTKWGVEKLAKALVAKGIRAESIHGNKTQGRRQRALDLFKRDHVQVLVATDVAARGLDIVGVSHVINFDLPASHEDYIHRVGRTGRAGKRGTALTFID
ncbi:DEAD/DEAH box helicase [Candidatus Wolfebacteria bacterium]|nr:DEAD/DEAH box helicase [Candidatus Wolfebacteria bacterium]